MREPFDLTALRAALQRERDNVEGNPSPTERGARSAGGVKGSPSAFDSVLIIDITDAKNRRRAASLLKADKRRL